ncbi:MAG: cyclase family protein [Acidobacteriota bacterium]|nr:cyclase family protein [Acidobacteriota bacterium]
MRIIDVSVPLSQTTPTYPGDPGVEIVQWSAIADGAAANVTLLNFGAHTATHVDAPSHFIEGAGRVDNLPLDTLIGPALVVSIPYDAGAIEARHLSEHDLRGAERVLFKTRNSDFWSDTSGGFRRDFTYITPDAARLLVESGVRLVGIDYLSVEEFEPERHLTHEILLSAGVVILEGLDLREASAGSYELICLPLKITGGTGDGAPARAVLRTLD